MARELISSDGTFYYKFVLPTFWTLAFGFGTLQPFFGAFGGSRPLPQYWMFPAAWVVGSVILWRSGARLEKVWIEGDSFIVSHFRREDTVPFAGVREVSGSRLVNPATIKISLDGTLETGCSIRFMPPIKFFLFPGQEHPMAARLRKLIAERTGKAID